MLLTEIAETVVELLNDNRLDWLPNDQQIVAKPCIDWVGEVCKDGFKVLVVPELIQYEVAVSGARSKINVLPKLKYLSILVGYTFKDLPYDGSAATWEETKYIIDTRESIEKLLVNADYSSQRIAVADVEAQPVNEQELDRRNFNAVTSIGFETIECNSGPELNSFSGTSNDSTMSPETRASIRRQHSYAKRLGRR